MATILKNASTIETDPIRNFRFLVRFIPHSNNDAWAKALSSATFGFTSVSGMAVTTDSIPYREGGFNTTVHQIPGQTSFAPLSMQRGVVIGTRQNWDWMRQLFVTVQGNAKRSSASNFRCDIEIDVLSHPMASASNNAAVRPGGAQDDHVSMRFKVYNAWITALAYSDLNAGDNAIFVEQMQLVHEGFDVSWATSIQDTGSAPFIDNGVTPISAIG